MLVEKELDWVLEHSQRERRHALAEQRQQEEARLGMIRAKELRQRQRYETGEAKTKRIVCVTSTPVFWNAHKRPEDRQQRCYTRFG